MADKTHSNMLFANFNQDYTCISVGTRKGYSVTNCDPFGRVYTMSAYKSSECQFLQTLGSDLQPRQTTARGVSSKCSSAPRSLSLSEQQTHPIPHHGNSKS